MPEEMTSIATAVFAPCYVFAEALEENAQSQNIDGGLHATVVGLGENMQPQGGGRVS